MLFTTFLWFVIINIFDAKLKYEDNGTVSIINENNDDDDDKLMITMTYESWFAFVQCLSNLWRIVVSMAAAPT